jgi:hypothetical protein
VTGRTLAYQEVDWTLKQTIEPPESDVSRWKIGRCSLVAEAIDDGISFGGDAMDKEGNGEIRTHFVDVVFRSGQIGAQEANAGAEVFPSGAQPASAGWWPVEMTD